MQVNAVRELANLAVSIEFHEKLSVHVNDTFTSILGGIARVDQHDDRVAIRNESGCIKLVELAFGKGLKEFGYPLNATTVLIPGHVLRDGALFPLNVRREEGEDLWNFPLRECAENVFGCLNWCVGHCGNSVRVVSGSANASGDEQCSARSRCNENAGCALALCGRVR